MGLMIHNYHNVLNLVHNWYWFLFRSYKERLDKMMTKNQFPLIYVGKQQTFMMAEL